MQVSSNEKTWLLRGWTALYWTWCNAFNSSAAVTASNVFSSLAASVPRRSFAASSPPNLPDAISACWTLDGYHTSLWRIAWQECGLLLQMSHVAWSVCLSVCVLITRRCPAKTAEQIKMPFGWLTRLENIVYCQTILLSELISPYIPARTLRSSNTYLLAIPTGVTSHFSSRSFSVSAPSTWNSLPEHIRSIDRLSTFKRQLKSHFFQSAFNV